MIESLKQSVESEDDVLERELFRYVSKGNYTSDELRHAYNSVCGVEEAPEEDERTHALYEMMRGMVDKQYPLNRFATLIETIEAQEEDVHQFVDRVSSLNISENEKRTLCSIAEKGRTGILDCHLGSVPIYRVKIPNEVEKQQLVKRYIQSMNTVLAGISDEEFASGKITFWFEES